MEWLLEWLNLLERLDSLTKWLLEWLDFLPDGCWNGLVAGNTTGNQDTVIAL